MASGRPCISKFSLATLSFVIKIYITVKTVNFGKFKASWRMAYQLNRYQKVFWPKLAVILDFEPLVTSNQFLTFEPFGDEETIFNWSQLICHPQKHILRGIFLSVIIWIWVTPITIFYFSAFFVAAILKTVILTMFARVMLQATCFIWKSMKKIYRKKLVSESPEESISPTILPFRTDDFNYLCIAYSRNRRNYKYKFMFTKIILSRRGLSTMSGFSCCTQIIDYSCLRP